MRKAIIGNKIGMTQLFLDNGDLVTVTVIESKPNYVLEVKDKTKNGYNAIKIGYNEINEKKLNKPDKGQFKKTNNKYFSMIKELRDVDGFDVGSELKVNEFKSGEFVDVQGYTKGRGFTGAIKRWNFRIGPMSHGAGYPHRYQGALGGHRGGSAAQHIFKNKKMSGQYGNEKITIQNLQVVKVDLDNNLIMVKGSIPGPKRSLVIVKSAMKKPLNDPNKINSFKLANPNEEAEKNTLIEKAKHFGLSFTLEMNIDEMNNLILEAQKKQDEENKKESQEEQKIEEKPITEAKENNKEKVEEKPKENDKKEIETKTTESKNNEDKKLETKEDSKDKEGSN